jgi:AcrR family transcriptional regulator
VDIDGSVALGRRASACLAHDGGIPADIESDYLPLVAEKGYSALTSAAVAKCAGVSTAVLYRRWPTKRSLFTHIARTVTLDAFGKIDTGTLRDDLRELLTRKQRLFGRVGSTLLVLMAEAHTTRNSARSSTRRSSSTPAHGSPCSTVPPHGARFQIPSLPPCTPALSILVGGGLARHARFPAPHEPGLDSRIDSVLTFVLAVLTPRTEVHAGLG